MSLYKEDFFSLVERMNMTREEIAEKQKLAEEKFELQIKELQQQLEELEEEQLSTERERRRENVMATLDNESEIVDEYYNDLLEDKDRMEV